MSKLSQEWYDRLVADSLPPAEAEALGIQLFRDGFRQTSNRYRMVRRGRDERELDLLTFKAFKAEQRRATELNAPCTLERLANCNIGALHPLPGKFMSRRQVPDILDTTIRARCTKQVGSWYEGEE